MPKKGKPSTYNISYMSPRKPPPRPKIFKPDRKSIATILKQNGDYKFKKGEIFQRMKMSTFAQLVLQIGEHNSVDMETPIDNGPDSYRPDTADNEVRQIQGVHHKGGGGDTGRDTGRDTSRSTLLQVVKGIGEIDVDGSPSKADRTEVKFEECPYLLLDVRDADAYRECHLISALSYPVSNLSKATNYETPEMWKYKNSEGKIIIIYDDDERIAPNAATTLVQRMYDNVFLLSGGLKVAYKKFPRGFITGTPNQTITEAKNPPKEIVMANQNSFTIQNLSDISSELDTVLSDKGSGSRLSNASTMSSRLGNASKMSRISNKDSRPAFK